MSKMHFLKWMFVVSFSLMIVGASEKPFSAVEKFADEETASLLFKPTDMTMALRTESAFYLRASRPLSATVEITFRLSTGKYDHPIIELHKGRVVIPEGNASLNRIQVKLKAVAVGHDQTIEANCTTINGSKPCELNTNRTVLRISVVHSIPMLTVIQIVGWIYFVAWSISFYPQIYLNCRRRSVRGLNFDFLALNGTGFLFYSLYNCAMFWIPIILEQYSGNDRDAVNPVQLNDVVFSLHALFATLVTIGQCFVYERGQQRISRICTGLLVAIWATAVIALIIASTKATTWLKFFEVLSGVKLGITLVKYVPQAYFNYRRKSTAGWSIGNILLDFTGGLMSVMQMFLLAYNNDDWKGTFGNFTKFGLGAISLLFDVLFIFQHYIFYRNSVSYDTQDSALDEEDRSDDARVDNSIHVPYVEANERRET